jgi:RHS repeat-associated protein
MGPQRSIEDQKSASRQSFQVAAPQLTLPKGGGAIRGIGEKFAANPVTGTGSMTVPIYTSPGRSGFGPQLSLSYDSGRGNSPFGFGWSLDLPSITRKTDKGLPQYRDEEESDTFILSGAEDLVPSLLNTEGGWVRDTSSPRTVYGRQYGIHRYRPRVEGLFARIERWTNLADPKDTFWRSISKDNITTWYGKTAESRVFDPADPSRIFSWLICESYDDKGNVIAYQYKAEDSGGVDLIQANERNRTDATRSANRYIKHIFYGNRNPYFPDLTATAPVALPTDWCFQLVFDYGEHDLAAPVPQDTGQPWNCRSDPFSTYRPTFEVRTYRLCRRALMFHHFADQPNVGLNCLVRSTDLDHSAPPPPNRTEPFYSYLLSVTQTGYVRNDTGGYRSKSLPPLEFEYTTAEIDETVRDVDPESIENPPYGLDGTNYRWADLDGEGLSGILTEQGGSWFYKPNLSPVNQRAVDGEQVTMPWFGPVQLVAREPSLASLRSGRQQLMDLSGDGKLDLVDFESPTPGFFERTEDANWEPFKAFQSLPVLDWRNPNLKFIDLTGDGFPDLMISEDDVFTWHPSLSTEGFGPAQCVSRVLDEEKGPQLVFADGTESIFLADMSGDGLTDLVRIRNGALCYWPNLGYGRFGPKVAMDGSPHFDRPDLFDGRRIRLADIDGSGTSDIVYFASGETHLYFNQSGNGWGAERVLSHFPEVESASSATALDLLGNGTACLVWSSSLPGNARQPMRYINLMGGDKPHLLTHVRNNLGAETVVQYSPSTKFYVKDKLEGTPWLTRLPFPVHVVERVETYDYISRNRFVTRYAYHHGYYDCVEREFRGFGRVDQWDTEEFATLSVSSSFPQATNEDAASNVPPVLTKTWFHTGVYFGETVISNHFAEEYYSEGDSAEGIPGLSEAQLEAMRLDDTVLPTTVLLPDGTRIPYDFSGEELCEACRSLRGSILRQEVYALDGSAESDRPYSASERNYTIEAFQPQGPNRYGAFFVHPRETVDFHYERKLFEVVGNTLADSSNPPPTAKTAADPRVTHALTLAADQYGNVLQSVTVAYGRRYVDPALTYIDQLKQTTLLGTSTENSHTNPILGDDCYRIPLPAESDTYELIQFAPNATATGVTSLFRFEELQTKLQAASDAAHTVSYENLNPTNLNPGQTYRRVIGRTRTLYRPDDMGNAAGDANALLPLGTLETLALPGSSYRLAFTPGLISQVFQRGGAALLPTPATVLGSTTADGGGYVDLDRDGHWWIPSGRVFYSPTAGTPVQERTQAVGHFYLPRRFEDPFGNTTSLDYDDSHDLLAVKTTDAVNNVVSATNDYRVLQPRLITDPNGSNAEVRFDALGMVVGTVVSKGSLGDSFTTFNTDPLQSQIDGFYSASNPHTPAAGLLGTATTCIVYDVQHFSNTRLGAPDDPTKWEPIWAATLARETHVSELANVPGGQSKIQITFSYSDGFGREIQKKVQAEPGPVVDGGPNVNPRWVGSGWTIFNNKGKPVRQYEPFFSQLALGHQFEFGLQVGVSPILFYDPVDRVVATAHPNHTYEKIVFDPWHQDTWDVNDTVLQSNPSTDSDVGEFFQRIPTTDYLPTWYTQRATKGGPEQDAAGKAAAHANTPTVTYFDTLGRTFLTIADNASGGKYPSRVELDIEGNQRSVRDAIVEAGDQQGRIVMRYDYYMLRNRIHQASMEAGERWTLNDATGKTIRKWDTRGHNFSAEYDALRRPTSMYVTGTDPSNSDPRTLGAKVCYEKITYGEGQVNDQGLNLRTRVFQHADAAGVVTNRGTNPVTGQDEAFDFKGNLLRSSRAFVSDYKTLPDWSLPPPTLESYTSSTQYDALNRPIALTTPDANSVLGLTTPDASTILPTYNEANLLESLSVNVLGSPAPTAFVTNIDYNTKGQRTLIQYGNGAETHYGYDPLTFRLVRLYTRRGAAFTQDCGSPPPPPLFAAPAEPPPDQPCGLQNLTYTFDPVGNITHIQDDAQQPIYFRNQRVEPSADYTYDAIYRLIQADGREHLGQNGGGPLPPTPTSYNDVPRVGLLHPNDGNAMGIYTEQYQYDPVGNFLKFIHRGTNPANPGWTRSYTYNEASLLEPGKLSNRLTSTTVSGNQPLNEPYTYDPQGNMTRMLHLQSMQWDFKDQLYMTRRQVVNVDNLDGRAHQGERTYYVYDAAGQRVRKATDSSGGIKIKERLYLGVFELYREYNSNGKTAVARETLHVTDDKKRVVIIEAKVIDTSLPATSLPVAATRYQLSNHLGTACLELDEAAAIITYEEYYPYGSTSYQAGRTTIEVSLKRYRYTGKERDEETGFYYFGARYFTPWLGRWISCDPAFLQDGSNLYVGYKDNPATLLDATGTATKYPQTVVTMPNNSKALGREVHAAVLGTNKKPGPLVQKLNKGLGDFGKAQAEVRTGPGGSQTPGSMARGREDLTIDTTRGEQMWDLKPEGRTQGVKNQLFNYGQRSEGGVASRAGTDRLTKIAPDALEPVPINKGAIKRDVLLSQPEAPGELTYQVIEQRQVATPIVERRTNLVKSSIKPQASAEPLTAAAAEEPLTAAASEASAASEVAQGASKVGKVLNVAGKVVQVGGGIVGSAAGGWQVGTGINQLAEGKTAEGAISVTEGSVNLGMTIGVPALMKAGVVVAGGSAAAVTGVTLVATASVGLAAETARAAVKGEETPIDVADKFYGTHFGDIYGWVTGAYSKR